MEKMSKIDCELDDLVIKALSHKERKNILRIVGSYPEGVNYTGILGDSALSTGRLNYHLGELTGFLDRDENRQYRLSELGKKAVAVLEFIKQDIDLETLNLANTKRASRLRDINKRMKNGLYVLGFVMISLNAIIWGGAYVENDIILRNIAILWSIGTVIALYAVNKSRKRYSEHFLRLIEWVEWRIIGKNPYRNN